MMIPDILRFSWTRLVDKANTKLEDKNTEFISYCSQRRTWSEFGK